MNSAQKTVRFYWGHVRKYPRLALPAISILPFNILLNNYLPPLVLASIINRLSQHDYTPHQVWASFGGDLLLYLALSLIGGTLTWRLFDLFFWRLEGNVQRSIARQVFSKLIDESADFHANQFGGSLVSATNKLMSSYVRLADTTLFQVAPLVFGLIFVTIIMSSRSLIYTVVLVSFALFYMGLSFFITGRVRTLGAEHAKAESKQTGVLADAVTNAMAIKSFAREPYERQRFASATDTTFDRLLDMMRAFQKQQMLLSSMTGVLSGVSLLAAVVSVVSFGANLATAFLIFSYTSSIVSQLFTFSNNALRNYNRSFGDASEMIDILASSSAVLDPIKPITANMHSGKIEFDHVTFTHNGSDDALFANLSLTIPAGQRVGLVGHSGSGKTTFTKVLLRFADIDEGAVRIDDQNIADVTQNDLHDRIAYVPQEPLLFHRSIEENIAYGDPTAKLAAIKRAAVKANAAEFIDGLPKGYHTLVGERGVKLSGGQRQRIAIARAILKDAPIIVLDEATSALDSESEALIQDALWKLMEGRTAIVIAHRLSTVQQLDRIIVMDNGVIAEDGSHAELLALNGTYASLWARQSGGLIED